MPLVFTVTICFISALLGCLFTSFFPSFEKIVIGTRSTPAVQVLEHETNEGWRFGNKFQCATSLVVHTLSNAERRNRKLSKSSILALTQSFRNCGVCVIENAFEPSLANNTLAHLEKRLETILRSRSRVRASLKDSMRRRISLHKTKARVLNETYFSSGNFIKERNDGRIDIELPWENPYNNTEVVLNHFVIHLLKNLLGHNAFDLKSNHVMYALNSKQGTRDQHWHRDTHLLFHHDSSDPPPLRDVHNKNTGASVILVDMIYDADMYVHTKLYWI